MTLLFLGIALGILIGAVATMIAIHVISDQLRKEKDTGQFCEYQ